MGASKVVESTRTFRMIVRTCGPYCKSAKADDWAQCGSLGTLGRRWHCFAYDQSLSVELEGPNIGTFKRCAQCMKEDE